MLLEVYLFWSLMMQGEEKKGCNSEFTYNFKLSLFLIKCLLLADFCNIVKKIKNLSPIFCITVKKIEIKKKSFYAFLFYS